MHSDLALTHHVPKTELFDCKSPQCICCQILTTRFSRVKGRFQIILVDENLGF